MANGQADAREREVRDRRDMILLEGHKSVLRQLANGAGLEECLSALCIAVEDGVVHAVCSVLLLTPDGRRLVNGAAPHVPRGYIDAIDGEPIGPQAGSCGTAAFFRREVVVEDIETDPLWLLYREPATKHGLAACASIPISDGTGQVLGTFAIYRRQAGPFPPADLATLRDMTGLASVVIQTQRRRAALAESEARFRLVAEETGQVVFDLDMASGHTVWLGAVVEQFGEQAVPSAGFEGLLALVHPDDREGVRAALAVAAPGDGPLRLEYRLRRRDGSVRVVNHHSRLLLGARGELTHHYGVLVDVTEQRATETALRERQKLDSLGLLAGGIAHDFNNVLAALLANVSLLAGEVGPAPGAAAHLDSLRSTIMRATELTRQLLAYAGRGRARVRRVDLSRLVEGMVDLLAVTVSKKIRLGVQLATGLPAVEADVGQLQQVVMNLVTNAVEAIGAGSGRVAISTALCTLDAATIAAWPRLHDLVPGRYVQLSVEDDGCGMTEDVAEHIFDPFYTTKKTGHGLGLSVMLGILRGHRAGIAVSSTPGQGSHFHLYLPATEQPADAPATPVPTAVATLSRATDGARGLALVVDDEPAIRRATALTLDGMGFDARQASDGREAVDIVSASPHAFAFVLMDLSMPRMSGREAWQVIRRLEPDLPVIIASGYGPDESLTGDEMTAFLAKPYQLEELQQTLGRLLGRRRAPGGEAAPE
ncbi:MAG TPA: ATP-binding protein [Polyangia bacterium]|nr:ATP-binding protein [Polyangia bacterium]